MNYKCCVLGICGLLVISFLVFGKELEDDKKLLKQCKTEVSVAITPNAGVHAEFLVTNTSGADIHEWDSLLRRHEFVVTLTKLGESVSRPMTHGFRPYLIDRAPSGAIKYNYPKREKKGMYFFKNGAQVGGAIFIHFDGKDERFYFKGIGEYILTCEVLNDETWKFHPIKISIENRFGSPQARVVIE